MGKWTAKYKFHVIYQKHFIFVNSYAPNDQSSHIVFLKSLFAQLKNLISDPEVNIVWGGDHNVVCDPKVDRYGGNPDPWNNSTKLLSEIMVALDLIDIWRVLNPTKKGFTWKRLNPVIIQSRLDYFLINDTCSLQSSVINTTIDLCGLKY